MEKRRCNRAFQILSMFELDPPNLSNLSCLYPVKEFLIWTHATHHPIRIAQEVVANKYLIAFKLQHDCCDKQKSHLVAVKASRQTSKGFVTCYSQRSRTVSYTGLFLGSSCSFVESYIFFCLCSCGKSNHNLLSFQTATS